MRLSRHHVAALALAASFAPGIASAGELLTGPAPYVMAAGPVDSVNLKSGTFVVAGQSVSGNPEVEAGRHVVVWGSLSSDGTIVANRVQDLGAYVAGASTVFAVGVVQEVQPLVGRARLANVWVDYTASPLGALEKGQVITVRGTQPARGGVVLAESVLASAPNATAAELAYNLRLGVGIGEDFHCVDCGGSTQGRSVHADAIEAQRRSIHADAIEAQRRSIHADSVKTQGASVHADSVHADSVKAQGASVHADSVHADSVKAQGASVHADSVHADSVEAQGASVHADSVHADSIEAQGASVHADSVHADSVEAQGASVHADSVHADSVHADSVEAQGTSVHADSI